MTIQGAGPAIEDQGAFWGAWGVGAPRAEGRGDLYVDQVCNLVRDVAARCPTAGVAADVGCGTGWITKVLTERFAKVWGVEIAADSLKLARRDVPQAELVLGDFLALEQRPTNCDLVVSCEVIAHVADQAAFIARCRSMLKPGGRLLLFTQNPVTWSRTRYVTPPDPKQIRHWLSLDEIRGHFSSAGLRVVSTRTLMPHGDKGLLFWRPVANGVLRRVIGRRATHRIFERLGLGRTIVVEAVAE